MLLWEREKLVWTSLLENLSQDFLKLCGVKYQEYICWWLGRLWLTLRFVLKSEFNLNRSKLCRLDNLFKFPLDCEEQANELLRRVFSRQSVWLAISDSSTIFTSYRVDNVWAPCFSCFLENNLSKVDKILKLTFLIARNDFEGLKTAFRSIYCSWIFARCSVYNSTPVHSRSRRRFVNSEFANEKPFCPENEGHLWQTKMKANVCRNYTFQENRTKNATGKRRLTSSNRAAMSALHREL